MGENSKIEWTHHTFNPWLGCAKVSPGCAHCYAERDMERYGKAKWGAGQPRVRTATSTWAQPLKWDRAAAKAGRRDRVFCASLADVFDDEVAESWRADLFSLIDACRNLDWLLLTKRPGNMGAMLPAGWYGSPWPHVWLGTTVEDQEHADLRIPQLLAVPAARRFLSCEPLLGQVDLLHWPGSSTWSGPPLTDTWDDFAWPEWVPGRIRQRIAEFWSPAMGRSPRAWAGSFLTSPSSTHTGMPAFGSRVSYGRNWIGCFREHAAASGRFVPLWNNIGAVVHADGTWHSGLGFARGPGWLERWLREDGKYHLEIDWIICGGESGPKARPMHPAWARSLRDQAQAAGVPFLFKQWGEYDQDGRRVGKHTAGRLLDGRTWDEVPA